MPYIEGTPLSRLVRAEQPWPAIHAAGLMRRLALAVNLLHQRGIIHRDLKPANVLLRPDGEPVLMDFGLARSFAAQSRRLTTTGSAVGTPVYMSPEQITGDPQAIGPGTDIYSLGVILFELVTGTLPFEGPLAAVYGQILHAVPPSPCARRPGLAPWVDVVCRRAMAKRPQDRFATAAEFATALEVSARQPVPAVAGAGDRPAPPTAAETDVHRLECPSCGKRLKVPRENLGKRIVCPGCQARLTTPAAARDTAPAVQPLTEPGELRIVAPPRVARRKRAGGRGGLLAAAVVGLTLLVGVVVGWLVLRGNKDEGKEQERKTADSKRHEVSRPPGSGKPADRPAAKPTDRKPPPRDTTGGKPPADPPPGERESPDAIVRGILEEVSVPPLGTGAAGWQPRFEDMPRFSAAALAAYPPDNKPTELRSAVEHARALLWALSPEAPPPELADTVGRLKRSAELSKVSGGLRRAYRAPSGANAERLWKEQIVKDALGAARMVALLEEELDSMTKAKGMRAKAPKRWQANYDFIWARLEEQIAHVYEYSSMLGQMRKEFPPLDRKVHGGWSMAPQEKLQGDSTGRKLHKSAQKILDRLVVEYAGTPWEILARRVKLTPVGLEWKPEK